jgi:hypothetical protein
MITVQQCDEKTLKKILAGLAKAALGQPVSFVFEEGLHRIVDEGKTFAAPNGTATLRVFINGGARDTGAPEVKPDVDVHGGAGAGGESVEALFPSVAAHCD